MNSRTVHTTSRDSLGGRETPGEVPNWESGKGGSAAGEEKKLKPLSPTCSTRIWVGKMDTRRHIMNIDPALLNRLTTPNQLISQDGNSAVDGNSMPAGEPVHCSAFSQLLSLSSRISGTVLAPGGWHAHAFGSLGTCELVSACLF